MPLIRIISKAMVATIAAGVAAGFVASGATAQSADRTGNPFLRLLPGQQSTTTTTTIVVERTRFRKSAWRSHDARSHDTKYLVAPRVPREHGLKTLDRLFLIRA